jgi:plasmid stabilization system protein ParE
MTVEIRFVDEAVAELDEAARWYEEQREGLGLTLLAALDRAVESMRRWPRAGSPVEGVPDDLDVRRVPVLRFPYFIAYLITDDDVIVVLAVAHERRRPRYWSDRAGS